jgi:hypothetical protein
MSTDETRGVDFTRTRSGGVALLLPGRPHVVRVLSALEYRPSRLRSP